MVVTNNIGFLLGVIIAYGFTNTQKWAPQNAWFESYDTKWVNFNLYCSWDRDYIVFVPAFMFHLGIYGMRRTFGLMLLYHYKLQ